MDYERYDSLVLHWFSADLRDFSADRVIVGEPVWLYLEPDPDLAVEWMFGNKTLEILALQRDGFGTYARMLNGRTKALESRCFLGVFTHGIGQEGEAILVYKHPDVACATGHSVRARFSIVATIMPPNR